MKIALLNDTHFGCRNDSPAFLNYQNRFYNELFFPYLKESGINTLIHLGDVVDRRKFINHNTADNFKRVFWNRLDELNIDTHVIIGNHDTYFKNTNDVNVMQNLNLSKNVKLYTKAEEVNIGGLDMLFLPWICDDNYEDSIYAIDNSTSQICMGHLEIKGFEMHSGIVNEHGLERGQFRRFEKVLSGHFHKKSDDGHIYYLGTQYQIMWSDYNCPKGFHIFDTDTRELEFIENPHKLFFKLWYDDDKLTFEHLDVFDFENMKDKYIKVIIKNKNNPALFDAVITSLENQTPINVQVVEDHLNLDLDDDDEIVNVAEDTLSIVSNYIDSLEIKTNKNELNVLMRNLYNEALSIE